MKIITGFLTGNLFDSWTGAEVEAVDADASCRRYASQFEAEIKKCFPDAEVEVRSQEGVGSLPYDLTTRVEGVEDHREEYAICEEVGSIGSDLYQLADWVVTRE